MKPIHIFLLGVSTWLPGAALAEPVPQPRPKTDLGKLIASLDGEYLSYSGSHGNRQVINATSRLDLGKTQMVIGIANGRRKAGDEEFKAMRLTGTLVHQWNERISTRTAASIASDKPVFVNRELVQEVSYKPFPQTVLTAGGRYARYFGGVDTLSWSVGATQYFRWGSVGYRFSSYDTQHIGRTTGHLVSAKFNDSFGSSQLWLGHGTALHDATWLATPEKGKFTNVEVRREQPVSREISLILGINRGWYETDSTKFKSTGFRLGLKFSDWPL